MRGGTRGSARTPQAKTLLRSLDQLRRKSQFTAACREYYNALFQIITQHLTRAFPRQEERFKWSNELCSILLHPSARAAAGQVGGLVVSVNLLVGPFRERWKIWPPHPALIYDIADRRHRINLLTLLMPASHLIYVWPWTTKQEVGAQYDQINLKHFRGLTAKYRSNASPGIPRWLPSRQDLRIEFLAEEGCDFQSIAEAVYNAPARPNPSDEPDEEVARRKAFIAQQTREFIRAGMTEKPASARAYRRAQRKWFPPETRDASKARKTFERLRDRLLNRLRRIPLP